MVLRYGEINEDYGLIKYYQMLKSNKAIGRYLSIINQQIPVNYSPNPTISDINPPKKKAKAPQLNASNCKGFCTTPLRG
jgi:hypothetical protein